MAKKPAIQMTNGIDDIIKGGIKAIRSASRVVTRSAPRTMKKFEKQGVSKKDAAEIVYGNYGREFGKGFGGKGFGPKQPPKPKELPSIKGKSPRPNVSKVNPKAPSTADVDRILKKAARDRAAAYPPKKKMR
jgi:hypothetical protein